MPRTATHVWQFASSSSDKLYETIQYSDGSTSCDCPGWTRRAERTCKHTRAVAMGIADTSCVRHAPVGKGATPLPIPAITTTAAPAAQLPLGGASFEREFS